jgi:alkylmercury lyase
MSLTSLSVAELDALAQRFVALFPQMNPTGARVVTALYRLLGQGAPVSWRTLAGVTGQEEPALKALLARWPGVYEEPRGLTGFGGLSVRAVSNHRLVVGGRTLFARCAWDTLFLPRLLGAPAQVSSTCAETGTPVRLTVTPRAVERLAPRDTCVSMLPPEPGMAADLTQHF